MLKLLKNKTILRFFPFFSWIEDLKDVKILKQDIFAWITVAFILIPQSMAYAQLAWLPVYIWLYTAFIWVIIAALFWSSKQMSTWPVTIISLMTATAITSLWLNSISVEEYIIYASLIAFFIWIFYLLLSVLKLWVIVEFLSHPVILWFTNAIAIITIISQLGKIFWVSYDKWKFFFEWIYNLILSTIYNIDITTCLFWIWSIMILFILRKLLPKSPKVLIVLVLSTFISYYIWFENIYNWKVVWNIPNNLPNFSFWIFNKEIFGLLWTEKLFNLMISSFIIWIIWFTESISVAKFIWTKTKQSINPNKELIWQWLANMTCSFFSWYWVAWSFSKTAVNLRAWAQTWLASVITWIMVMLTIIYLTPYLYYLPITTLAAIIIVSVSDLIKIKPIIKAYKINKYEWLIAIFTLIITLLLSPNIELGILIWIILSLTIFMYKTMRPRLVEVAMYKDWLYRDKETMWLKTSKKISIFRIDSELFFANASYFETNILKEVAKKEKLKYVIIDMEWVSDIDSSWIENLEKLIDVLKKEDIKIYLTSLRVKVINTLEKIWFFEDFFKKYLFTNNKDALKHIQKQEWNKINLKPLLEYCPKKKKKNGKEKVNEDWKELLDEIIKKQK